LFRDFLCDVGRFLGARARAVAMTEDFTAAVTAHVICVRWAESAFVQGVRERAPETLSITYPTERMVRPLECKRISSPRVG
jgi:hypothetical protein